MERKNAWAAYAEDDSRVEAFAKAYCDFINNGKTERECVAYGEKLAKAHGFEGSSIIAMQHPLVTAPKIAFAP